MAIINPELKTISKTITIIYSCGHTGSFTSNDSGASSTTNSSSKCPNCKK